MIIEGWKGIITTIMNEKRGRWKMITLIFEIVPVCCHSSQETPIVYVCHPDVHDCMCASLGAGMWCVHVVKALAVGLCQFLLAGSIWIPVCVCVCKTWISTAISKTLSMAQSRKQIKKERLAQDSWPVNIHLHTHSHLTSLLRWDFISIYSHWEWRNGF